VLGVLTAEERVVLADVIRHRAQPVAHAPVRAQAAGLIWWPGSAQVSE
jgi:hypothetical protein